MIPTRLSSRPIVVSRSSPDQNAEDEYHDAAPQHEKNHHDAASSLPAAIFDCSLLSRAVPLIEDSKLIDLLQQWLSTCWQPIVSGFASSLDLC